MNPQIKNDIEQPQTPTPQNVMPDVPLHLSNLDGFIQSIDFVPTYIPSRFIDQVVLVTSGGSSFAYIYDTKASSKAWRPFVKVASKRVVTVTQSATPAINTDNTEIANITGLAQAITSFTSSLSGTPNPYDSLIICITDNGTARAITWGASFEASTVALPTTTVISTLLMVGFFWNSATSKWRCVAVA